MRNRDSAPSLMDVMSLFLTVAEVTQVATIEFPCNAIIER
jgi:hypothetical protein